MAPSPALSLAARTHHAMAGRKREVPVKTQDTEPLIRPRFEPRPVSVDFRPVGRNRRRFAIRRAEYVDRSGERFVITAGAKREHERALDKSLERMRFWAESVEPGTPRAREIEDLLVEESTVRPKKPAREDNRFRTITRRIRNPVRGDEDATVFVFNVDLVATAENARNLVVFEIDPVVRDDQVYWYNGGQNVRLSIANGRVRLRRRNRDPLDVNPPRKVAAPNGCTVKGVAARSTFTIQGAGQPTKVT
jgi:hypothetical protein